MLSPLLSSSSSSSSSTLMSVSGLARAACNPAAPAGDRRGCSELLGIRSRSPLGDRVRLAAGAA
ncbi:hypothetical protein AcW1_005177 [Taiwanofungus camphoratus]|nr:hypothetical protein AcW1_005177 [Antrodia cinnamomea]